MKIILSLVLTAFCCITYFGQTPPPQKPDEKVEIAVRQRILKKQIFVDNLDNQAKDVSLTAARVFVRFKLAQWLWKDGKDETGRAESLAVRALEELFEKKARINRKEIRIVADLALAINQIETETKQLKGK